MNIDINTKFITLIGTPLKQSFAARMQNAGYEAAGLNMVYFYTDTGDSHLEEIINGIRYMPSFAGCAVTKPNKVRVLEYLDELDPLCEKMGACNTVLRTPDNRLIGYNTDCMGFYKSIENETDFSIGGSVCFCIGAGGAGRAICSALAFKGAGKVFITDRIERNAFDLMDDINLNFGNVTEFVSFGDFSKVKDCSLVINATGIGMGKTIGESPMPAEYIDSSQFYFDACYNPSKTQFLINAERKGCRILNGLGMSLYQGVAQIEIWTGQSAPVNAMRKELIRITRENQLNSVPVIEGRRK